MPATPTLETYLRSPAPSSIRKGKPAGTASSTEPTAPTSTKAAQRTPTSVKRKGKATPTPKGSTKKRKKAAAASAFVPDNRDLGTLDLLSDSSQEDDAEVLQRVPAASARAAGAPAKRIALEEEDWARDDDAVMKVGEGPVGSRGAAAAAGSEGEAFEEHVAAVKPVVLDDGPEGTANLLAASTRLADPAEQDPFDDGCKDAEEDGETRAKAAAGFTGCECGSEDEVLVVEEGPTCPRCKLLLDTLPKKKRDSHVESCLASSASTGATPSNVGASTSAPAPSRGLLAPLSRLFSRALPDAASTSARPTAPDVKGKGKAPVSLLSSLPNAFTALMAGHTETKQWKAAEEADKQKGRRPKGEEKKVPFYKWIDGLEITVDAFKYGRIEGCKGYFLSHAHSDHYQQLSSSWSHGPIYASQTTINLIKLKLGVKDEWLHALPLDETVKVDGIDVTLIDANHCPGSVLFLFEGPHTDPKSPYSKTPNRIFRYLHCGDFRASPQHIVHPCMSTAAPPSTRLPASTAMSRSFSSSSSSHSAPPFVDPLPGRIQKKLDAIYLDTTYLAPSYCFPAQELVINACADLVRERIVGGDEDALWRADGRESERKGLKGWLAPGVKGEDLKDEEMDGEGAGELMEMDALPEEMDEGSQAPEMPGGGDDVEEGDGEMAPDEDAEEDEEAWRAAHGDEESQAAPVPPGGDAAPTNAPVTPVVPQPVDDVGESARDDELEAVKVENESAVELEERVAVKDEDTPPAPVCVKNEDVDVADDAKPDVKPDIKPDVKPDIKPKKERLLVLVGTYSIGKERIVKAIAHALSTKIYCDARKRDLFLAQDDPDLHSLLTDDPLAGQVHVGWLRDINREVMSDYLAKYKAPRVEGGFTKMIGLRPTGWTYRSETKDKVPSIPKILALEQQRKFSPAGLYPQRDSTPMCMAFGVPYSEHSSFFELTCFALSLDYTRIIPTVNVHTAASRTKMKSWIDRWAAEKKRRADARMPRIVPFRALTYW